MEFDLNKTIEILERTPNALSAILSGISNDWTSQNEGGETWSPFDVVGHLIHGENTDWIERMDIILTGKNGGEFVPFDRFAQFEESKGKNIYDLLNEFASIRKKNLDILKAKNLKETDLDKTGIHPKFGAVTLRQLLSTWAVHDLDHISQISRVMAKQYKTAVGPWIEYLRILNN